MSKIKSAEEFEKWIQENTKYSVLDVVDVNPRNGKIFMDIEAFNNIANTYADYVNSQKLIEMKLQTQLSHAIYLASLYHNNVYDKAGEPYILHVLWVMNKVRHLGHKYMIVAVLHDILEDTAMTIPYLKKHIFEDEVLEALKLLTHTEGRYDSYINKIIDSGNDIAIQVKLRDLEHNSKITRLKGIEDKDVERMKKYHKSYMKLKKYKA